jgi:hypothetical protein
VEVKENSANAEGMRGFSLYSTGLERAIIAGGYRHRSDREEVAVAVLGVERCLFPAYMHSN